MTTSAVRRLSNASRRYALMAGVCAATLGLVACGSDDKKTTTTTGTTTGGTTTGGTTTTGTTTATTAGTTTGTTSDCAPSGNAAYVGDTTGVTITAADGTVVDMKYALFIHNPNANDPNKKFGISFFDYDYCAFAFDHGYSFWPIDGFHAASFYLVSSTNTSASFTDTTYTIGAADNLVYVNASSPYGSGVTVAQTSTGGAKCTGTTYPTLASGTVVISGGVDATKSTITGATGSINVTLGGALSGTMAGSFTSGTCNNSPASSPTTPDSCSCSL